MFNKNSNVSVDFPYMPFKSLRRLYHAYITPMSGGEKQDAEKGDRERGSRDSGSLFHLSPLKCLRSKVVVYGFKIVLRVI